VTDGLSDDTSKDEGADADEQRTQLLTTH